MNFSEKLIHDDCSIVVLFSQDKCHVSLTTRGERHAKTLVRNFAKVNVEVLNWYLFKVGYLNYWDRVQTKYAWRYMMWKCGHKIINQDGTEFSHVDAQTWVSAQVEAEQLRRSFLSRPIQKIISDAKRSRKAKFLPLQVIRKAIDAAGADARRLTEFPSRLVHRNFVRKEDLAVEKAKKVRKKRPKGARGSDRNSDDFLPF